MNVLAKITELREERKWSIYQLSRKTGLDSKTIYKWYNNETTPTLKALEAIAQAFEVPLYELFIEYKAQAPNQEEIELLEKWSKLSKKQKDAISKIIDTYL